MARIREIQYQLWLTNQAYVDFESIDRLRLIGIYLPHKQLFERCNILNIMSSKFVDGRYLQNNVFYSLSNLHVINERIRQMYRK